MVGVSWIVDKDNLQEAISLQASLFPADADAGRRNLIDSVEGRLAGHYWLYEVDDFGTVGMRGIYSVPADDDSAWLGWFGVKPEFRRRGYAYDMLLNFEEEAKRMDYDYVRLYTEHDNIGAKSLYEKCGYTCEPYECEEDDYPVKIDIYSKSLSGKPCSAWGNKNLHLGEELSKK